MSYQMKFWIFIGISIALIPPPTRFAQYVDIFISICFFVAAIIYGTKMVHHMWKTR